MTSILGIHLVLLGPYRLGQPQVAWLNDEEDGVLSVGQGTLNRFFAAHVLVLQAIAGSRNGSCSRVSPLAGMLVFHVFVNWLLPPVCSQFAICGC